MGVSARTLEKMVARGRTQALRETIRDERAYVSEVKGDRRARLQAITEKCRAMRAAHTTDAKRQRAELRAAIENARGIIKDKCAKARGKTDEETAELLLVALGELEDARDRLRRYLSELKLPPKDPGKVRGGVRAAELRGEIVEQVAYDLEGGGAPELVPVWRSMARRMPKRYQASPHQSAYEGFLGWAGDHGSDVLALQERSLQRDVKEWTDDPEGEQRAAHDAAEKKRKRELRKLTKKWTDAAVRKLDNDQAIERFEEITIALQLEADGETVAKLRTARDRLQGELIRRGLLDYSDDEPEAYDDEPDREQVPF